MRGREFRVVPAPPKAEAGGGRRLVNGNRRPRIVAPQRPAAACWSTRDTWRQRRLSPELTGGSWSTPEVPTETRTLRTRLVPTVTLTRRSVEEARRSTRDTARRRPSLTSAGGRRSTPEVPTGERSRAEAGRARGRPRGPRRPPPATRGLLVDPCGGERRKDARGPEPRGGRPTGARAANPPPGRGPAGHGPGSARPPPRFPPTRSPGPVPARSGRAAPAVNGEEAGTEEAGRADRGRAPSLPPLLPRPWSAGEAGREEGRRTDGRTAPDAHAPPGPPRARADKPLCRGLTFNRSQRGSCSATYETPTQKQVVYEWFSARFPTNVRCVTGEGAAAFPAAPRFPGRGALRTGPRSRRAAGHAPSSPRARGAVGGGAARRRGQAGDRLSEANRGSAALPYRSAWAGF